MERREDREILRKGGFKENEMLQLSKLRTHHAEQEKMLAQEAHRRLEFVRWLVTTGKLSEQIA